MAALANQVEILVRLIKTDPDPRVRHRAQAVRLVAEGESVSSVARLFRTAPHRVRTWRNRFLADGRRGLADAPRTGRPPKLGPEDLSLLAEALERGPTAYGWPVTVWSIRDLADFLARERGVQVCPATINRAVRGLGYRYRRPRHDLRHRQDPEAVAAAAQVLAWLKKTVPQARMAPDSSIWTSARSTPTHGWRRSGNVAGSR